MGYCNLSDIKQYALNSKYGLWEDAKAYGRDVKIYLHWSAGKYESVFSDYHINILGDGRIWVATTNFAEVLNHTYMRNTGSVGVSLCCAYNANTNNLGSYAPTAKQIEIMSQVTCVLADALDLTIDKYRVMTHGEAADNEDGLNPGYESNGYPQGKYGPKNSVERWDLEFLGTSESPKYNPWATDGSRGGDVLRGKANWYRGQGLTNTL